MQVRFLLLSIPRIPYGAHPWSERTDGTAIVSSHPQKPVLWTFPWGLGRRWVCSCLERWEKTIVFISGSQHWALSNSGQEGGWQGCFNPSCTAALALREPRLKDAKSTESILKARSILNSCFSLESEQVPFCWDWGRGALGWGCWEGYSRTGEGSGGSGGAEDLAAPGLPLAQQQWWRGHDEYRG